MVRRTNIKTLIKGFSNKRLTDIVTSLRLEKEQPRRFGPRGTRRTVPASEFFRGNISTIREEVARRKRLGLLRKSAGRRRGS